MPVSQRDTCCASQAMVYIGQSSLSGSRSVRVFALLGQQIKNSNATHTSPHPKLSWLGMGLVSVVPKVFGHSWPLFAQSESQAGVKVLIRGDTVRNRLGVGK